MFYFILFYFIYVLEVLKKNNYGEMIMAETLTSKVFI